jgi:hypothetical protein
MREWGQCSWREIYRSEDYILKPAILIEGYRGFPISQYKNMDKKKSLYLSRKKHELH